MLLIVDYSVILDGKVIKKNIVNEGMHKGE